MFQAASTFGGPLSQASCCADGETEAQKRKNKQMSFRLHSTVRQSQAGSYQTPLCQVLLPSGSGNLEQEGVFCLVVMKYTAPPYPPPPRAAWEGLSLSRSPGGPWCERARWGISHMETGKLSFDGRWARDVDLGKWSWNGNVGSQGSPRGAGGWGDGGGEETG